MALTHLENASIRLELDAPEQVIAWAAETFDSGLIATSSFQTQSLPLLHMISKVAPHVPILFADTGYHFPETIAFRDRVVDQLGLNLIIASPDSPYREPPIDSYPDRIENIDACCGTNKISGVASVMKHYQAWISGIRRDQTPSRENTSMISFNPFFHVYKIAPVLDWSRDQILGYIEQKNLPRHPLWEQGYRSIGCLPCTQPVANGDSDRSGRWEWMPKIECGLHEL